MVVSNYVNYNYDLDEEYDERFYEVTNSATDAIITINSEGIIAMWNKAAEDIFGYSKIEAIGNNIKIIIPERLWDIHEHATRKVIHTGEKKLIGNTVQLVGVKKDKQEFHIELSLSTWTLKNQVFFTGIIRDITKRISMEKSLELANEQLQGKVKKRTLELTEINKKLQLQLEMRKVAESELEKSINIIRDAQQNLSDIIDFLPDATLVVDKNRRVIAWNRAIEKMTGINKEEILHKGDYAYALPFYGEARPILIDLILDNDEEIKNKYEFIQRKGDILYSETFVPQAFQGRGAYLWATASPLYSNDGKIIGAIETIRDVTERKNMENQLKFIATHDPLTDVPNRRSLEDTLNHTVNKAKKGLIGALLLIDLDNFKIVNDTFGHIIGDEVLIKFVDIINKDLKETDLIFRIGGDEFAILVEETSLDDAMALSEKLRSSIEQSEICLGLHRTCFTHLTISVGIVIIDGKLSPQKLISYADSALYLAKEQGRNKVVIVENNEKLGLKLNETNKIIRLIKNALKENGFVLLFQSVVNNLDKKINHYEVLLRMKDKDQLISPNTFIPVAERFGLMPQIDFWVIRESLKILYDYSDINLMINLSGASLGNESLLKFIEEQISLASIKPSRIGFEITETTAVRDIIQAQKWINSIKKLGCTFALDDFGIGFSSFAYLRMLPVDYLKIDGTFVRDLDRDSTHRALVVAINDVAKTLGKQTIAEFVENEHVLEELKKIGVDYSQGFCISKPKTIYEIINIEVNSYTTI